MVGVHPGFVLFMRVRGGGGWRWSRVKDESVVEE